MPPDGLRDDVAQAERDCVDLIAALARPGPLLAYAVTVRFAPTSTPAQLAMAGACCRATRRCTCRRTWPRTAPSALGGRSCFPRAQLPRRLPQPRPACNRARCWRTASGSTPPTARCWPTAGRRSPIAPAPTCSWAAACSTGRGAAGRGRGGHAGQRCGRRHQPVDAAHDGRRLQGAGAAGPAPDGVEGAVQRHARRGARAAPGARDRHASSPARWPTSRSGTGPWGRWRSTATAGCVTCTNACSPG
jgi:hypothetical protein